MPSAGAPRPAPDGNGTSHHGGTETLRTTENDDSLWNDFASWPFRQGGCSPCLRVSVVVVAVLAALVPFTGARAASVDGQALAEEKQERERKPQDDWDRFMKAVLGFEDLVGGVSARKLTFRKLPPATGLRGQVRIAGKNWHFENIRGDVCGGRASADAAVLKLPDDRGRRVKVFRLKMRVDAAKLEELTRFYDLPVMGGSVSGSVVLSASSEKRSLHGKAEFNLRNADLGRLPLAIKAVSFVFLGFPRLQREIISQADGHVTLTPRGLVFQDLSLRSETGSFSIEAERNGTINYKGEIDLYLRPVFAEGVTRVVPGLPEVIDAIRGRGGRVRVTGTVLERKFKWGAIR